MSRRRDEPFAALIERRGKHLVCSPLFEVGGQLPVAGGRRAAKPGAVALVQPGSRGSVSVVAELGRADVALDVVEALVWETLGGRGFSERLESEAGVAARAAQEAEEPRRDLRDLATFTVDPASARDFDDAVSAREEDGGVRLWIHIADVAQHVRAGSPLDGEAALRATSVYVPGSVEPMLPHDLSGDACSLAPGRERLAVTTEMELGPGGEVRSVAFYRSLVRSDARLDYDQLDRIFAGRDRAPAEAAEPLDIARRVAAGLADRRGGQALEVDSREPEFSFDGEGHVESARGVEQTEAHRLIEQLMVLTNEQVASQLERRRVPALYRIHEQPDPDRIGLLFEQLAALDLPAPALPETIGPSEAGELAVGASRAVAAEAERRGHGREAYTTLVLRSLKQARYSHENLGHAGLGSPAYAHFTSPIRRYPDLVCHRALMATLGAGEPEPEPSAVREAGWWCSEREREAITLERRADRACSAFLLERELFERGWGGTLEGEVVGLVGAGLFVRFRGERADVYEGFLPARTLPGERFELDATETAHVGLRTARRLRLGDGVQVRVTGIEAPRGRVDLEPVGKWAEAPGSGRGAKQAAGKGPGGGKGSGNGKGSGSGKGSGGGKQKGGPTRRGAGRGAKRGGRRRR